MTLEAPTQNNVVTGFPVITNLFDESDIDHGVVLTVISDEVAYWVLKDGRVANRFLKSDDENLWWAVEKELFKLQHEAWKKAS